MNKNIYLFSGLGADESVFCRLDFSGFRTTFIKWEKPDKNESIEHYAKRLQSQITDKNPILIGLSFGGIMAAEVAKQIQTEKVIIISSVKTKHEIPFYNRLIGSFRLNKFIPINHLLKPNFMLYWFFGTSTEADKALLDSVLPNTDPVFFKWALGELLCWKNEEVNEMLIHIHGTADRILPYKFVAADITIQNGGHFMIFNRAEEINRILRELLNPPPYDG